MLSSGALQNSFKIVKSPGDGFCLLHSMCVSLKAQFPHICDFNVTKLIKLLKEEAIRYKQIYSIAIKSPGALEYEMYDYINNKNYDSDFGDIVPLLLANSKLRLMYAFCIDMNAWWNIILLRVKGVLQSHVFLYINVMNITMQFHQFHLLHVVTTHRQIKFVVFNVHSQVSKHRLIK